MNETPLDANRITHATFPNSAIPSLARSIKDAAALEALPDFTVVVSNVTELEGKPVCICVQKLAGEWYTPGLDHELPPDILSDQFWPAKVVFTL